MDEINMLKKEEYLKKINSYLGSLKNYVELNNSINLTDINKLSEDFFAELLNRVFDLDLVNMNLIEYNYPAIDLGDKDSRICYQVTATNDGEKIQYTLSKFNEYSLNEKFDELYIFILTNKKNYSRTFKVYDTGFTKSNIMDTTDLIKEISRMKNIKKIKNILDYLESELNDGFVEVKDKSYGDGILKLLSPEIQSNVSKILSQSNVVRLQAGNLKFNLRDVFEFIDESSFMDLRNTGGSFLLFGQLDVKQYEKFESELLKIKTDNARYTLDLYSQFQVWNKYEDLFHMRKDEYSLFRGILFEELKKWEVKTDEIL